jgi:hypothetical protein
VIQSIQSQVRLPRSGGAVFRRRETRVGTSFAGWGEGVVSATRPLEVGNEDRAVLIIQEKKAVLIIQEKKQVKSGHGTAL